jgi:hypothetical protein
LSEASQKALVANRFQKGQSGNPGGKAAGTRNSITARFLNDLHADYEEHGKKAIADAREQDPVAYVKVIAALLPKQVERTQPLDDLSDAELLAGIALLRGRLTGADGAGATAAQQSH